MRYDLQSTLRSAKGWLTYHTKRGINYPVRSAYSKLRRALYPGLHPRSKPMGWPTPDNVLRKMNKNVLCFPQHALVNSSIIIPAWNHFEYTYTCLESIAKYVKDASFEIIVVDDHSSDQTSTVLARVNGIRLISNKEQCGFIGSCNIAANEARGRYLIFLNNDTQVTTNWLEELLATFAIESKAGLVGSKLLYPDGLLQEAGGIIWQDGSGANYGKFDDPDKPCYNYLREVDYCSGASLAIPRTLFESLGGFDPYYAPAYYEDTDLAFRVRQSGYKVFYQPLSQVFHFEGISSGTDVKKGVKRNQVLNQAKFVKRWDSILAAHSPPGTPVQGANSRFLRKRILIIDHMVPEPDQDSGSLRMFNMLRILHDLSYDVTFVSIDNLNTVQRYTADLQRRGIEVLYRPYLYSIRNHLRSHGNRYSVILLSRPDTAARYIRHVRRYAPQAQVVFDTVDLHFIREEREAVHCHDSRRATHARRRKKQELALVRQADCTFVVSELEKAVLKHAYPKANVRVVSNIHDVVTGEVPSFSERKDIFFMGGFNHSPNVDAVTYFIHEIFPLVRSRLSGILLYIIGSSPPACVRELQTSDVIVTGYVSDLTPYLRNCRLSIAPLRFGAGVKGKINLSMNHGVPVVATSLAVEGMHLSHGEDVFIADTTEDFVDAIDRVYMDPSLWLQLSQKGKENVEKHFSFAAATTALRQFTDALQSRSVSNLPSISSPSI